MNTKVVIYTDGACRGNPGPGGWGVVLGFQDKQKTLNGYAPETTNNRMELIAVIEALRALKRSCDIEINTDSKYVMQGITEWLHNWKRNGWKTAAKKPVKNVDLWQQLDDEVNRHEVDWRWVKGHSGVAGNEHADQLANAAIDAAAQR
jgi:ribonuclease HI